jgi:hypothetical protein
LRNLFFLAASLLSFTAQANSERLKLLADQYPDFHERLFRNLRDQPLNTSYDFDANRTVGQMLEQGMGGSCNTHALVAAESLMRSGVPAADLRIVSAVDNRSLDALCFRRKQLSALKNDQSLSGHVFLLLRSGAAWYLVNTTTVPGTPPAEPFAHSLNLEFVEFHDPETLAKKMEAGPVSVPPQVTTSLPKEIFGPLSIFHVERPDQYKPHDFEARRRLIASGNLNSDLCRYDASPARGETVPRVHSPLPNEVQSLK